MFPYQTSCPLKTNSFCLQEWCTLQRQSEWVCGTKQHSQLSGVPLDNVKATMHLEGAVAACANTQSVNLPLPLPFKHFDATDFRPTSIIRKVHLPYDPCTTAHTTFIKYFAKCWQVLNRNLGKAHDDDLRLGCSMHYDAVCIACVPVESSCWTEGLYKETNWPCWLDTFTLSWRSLPTLWAAQGHRRRNQNDQNVQLQTHE